MVVLSAAVLTKGGKTLLARQFVEMSRIRIEGLLAAFPGLVQASAEHTFVETDAVRYLYQPIESLYVLLITTKKSNIVEDLETLRLISKILPEYSPRYGIVDENGVTDAAFEILYSLDEVLDWGGLRQAVSLQQIATYTEMYSHEERLSQMIKESKMAEAKEVSKRRAEAIARSRGPSTGGGGDDRFGGLAGEISRTFQNVGLGGLARDIGLAPTGPRAGGPAVSAYAAQGGMSSEDYAASAGGGIGGGSFGGGGMGGTGGGGGGMSGFGSSGMGGGGGGGGAYGGGGGFDGTGSAGSFGTGGSGGGRPAPVTAPMPGSGKGMSLGKARRQDTLLDAMRKEGEVVDTPVPSRSSARPSVAAAAAASAAAVYAPPMAAVHVSTAEKINVQVSRDGGVSSMDVKGDLFLRINDAASAAVRVAVVMGDNTALQMRTHPNIDKTLFATESTLGLKDPSRPFPTGNPLGVLRWRMQSKDESLLPLSVTCWPSDSGDDSVVNLEYDLGSVSPELRNVEITVPIPTGAQPVVSSCDGEFTVVPREQAVRWSIPVVDGGNNQGSLEFSVSACDPDAFFPVRVSFESAHTFAKIAVNAVSAAATGEPVNFTNDATLTPEKFTIE